MRQIPAHARQFGTPCVLRLGVAITAMLSLLMALMQPDAAVDALASFATVTEARDAVQQRLRLPSPNERAAIVPAPVPSVRVATVGIRTQYGRSVDDWGAPE